MSKATNFEQLKKLAQRADARLDAVEADVAAITVPEKVSDLENDAGYQTAEQVQAAAAAVAAGKMTAIKVDTIDDIDLTADDAERHIYLVPNGDEEGNNLCDEYIVVNGALEMIGTTAVDLTGYVQKVDGKGLSTNDFTDDDKAKLDGIEFATDAEVDAMLDEVFGAGE